MGMVPGVVPCIPGRRDGCEMVVEIDSKYWMGLEVNEKDVVELSGEVDKEYFETKLDVKSPVQKVQ